MTELEKIERAKSMIDKLANGINPLDDTPVSEENLINDVRLSRCFFYVSGILQKEVERVRKKAPKEKKPDRLPFSISPGQLQDFEYESTPISATVITRKINWLVWEKIQRKEMEKLSYRAVTQWLLNIGMIEYREWRGGILKRFPTAAGEEIGLVVQEWKNYGKVSPVVFFSEEAQKFVIDHIDAVIATDVKAGKMSYPWGVCNGKSDEDEL